MSTGAASVSRDGGVPQGHAPYLSGVCGRHDPTGGPDRGQPPAQPAAQTQTGHHLRKGPRVSGGPSCSIYTRTHTRTHSCWHERQQKLHVTGFTVRY